MSVAGHQITSGIVATLSEVSAALYTGDRSARALGQLAANAATFLETNRGTLAPLLGFCVANNFPEGSSNGAERRTNR